MARPKKVRADALLVEQALAVTLQQARARIMAGEVFVRDAAGHERRVDKAGEPLDLRSTLRLAERPHPYVSRGGVKLQQALDEFDIDPRGLTCADIGISTGGFTDCLLSRGAARVHGVDVGYGQTAWKIRTDPRVVLHERTNARHLTAGAFGDPVALLVVDVSFIGLSRLLPVLVHLVDPGGQIVALVKPQFELPASAVEAGGVVRDPELRQEAVDRVGSAARALGLEVAGQTTSPIKGAEGNVEFLVWLRAPV